MIIVSADASLVESWTFMVLFATLIAGALWCRSRVQREHRSACERSSITAVGVYAAYLFHLGLVTAAAIDPAWTIPLPEIPSVIGGCLIAAFGLSLFVAGVCSFRSFQRVSGTDVTELVTSGAYSWSRNPQNVGWSLLVIGIALTGRSVVAMLLALGFSILFHFYVTAEEAFLEQRFGSEYREYRRRTHRYFGPPRRRCGGSRDDRYRKGRGVPAKYQ